MGMRFLLIFAVLLLPFYGYAQKESNIWYFGENAGVDFNSGNPVALTDGQMVAYEGCASIADENGKLLFYTNGEQVWNAKHEVMMGGTINGDTDAGQSSVIVKQPGSDSLYFIFTNDGYSLGYAIVDISLDNGLGAVVAWSTKLKSSITEGLTAVRHCNGRDVWVLVQSFGSNSLNALLLTETGIEVNPVVSAVGHAPGAKFGYIRTSLKGDKIAISKDNIKEIYHFNNATGKAGQHIFSFTNPGYGFDFSPDGSKFYVCDYMPVLFQFDLDAGDQTAILNSKYDFAFSQKGTSAISCAPDGKMYLTRFGYNEYLTAINKPNLKGVDAELKIDIVDLKGRRTVFGLPEFLRGEEQGTKFDIEISQSCLSDTVYCSIKNTSGLDSARWMIKDESAIEIISMPGFHFSAPLVHGQTYEISSVAYSADFCELDTIRKKITPLAPIQNKTFDTTVCSGSDITLHAGVEGSAKYNWSTGSKDSVVSINKAGKYWVDIKRGSCTATYTFTIKEAPAIWLELGEEYFICEEDKELVKLDAGKGYDKYLWHPTGDTSQWIIVSKTGEYYVIVSDFRGCSGDAGTIVQRQCPGYVYYPNSFTPNGDLINDLYQPVGQDVIAYELSIYNRWGELVFQTDKFEEGWDGTFKGRPSPEGTYIWMSRFSILDDGKVMRKNYKQDVLNLMR